MLTVLVAVAATACSDPAGPGADAGDPASGAKAGTGGSKVERALQARVDSYWDLKVQGDTIQRYQEFMSTSFKQGDGEDREGITLEDFVRRSTGAATYTGAEFKKAALDESGESARVLVEYQWHISPGIAPVKMTPKTASWESKWVLDGGKWCLDMIYEDDERTMLD